MALPLTRNTSYVAGVSQVKSADLNDIQDKIIDNYGAPLTERYQPLDASFDTVARPAQSLGVLYALISGASKAYFTLRLPVGKRITDIVLDILEGNAAGEEIVAKIYSVSAVGARVQVSTTKTGGTSGGTAQLSWTSADTGVPFTLAGLAYHVEVEFKQASSATESGLYLLSVTHDRVA